MRGHSLVVVVKTTYITHDMDIAALSVHGPFFDGKGVQEWIGQDKKESHVPEGWCSKYDIHSLNPV